MVSLDRQPYRKYKLVYVRLLLAYLILWNFHLYSVSYTINVIGEWDT